MARLPGSKSDVYFGGVDEPLPDWRKAAKRDPRQDNDDDTPTAAERRAVVAILGFDPREPEKD